MKISILRGSILAVALIGAIAFVTDGRAASSGAPAFQLDPSWPKVPAKYKLGDVSSIAVDAQDNIWILHRPRTLPANQASMAAPPVMVFDNAGNFIKGWGGAGSGYEWPEREHGITIDSKGFVWIGGNNCAGRALPGLLPKGDDQILKFTQDGKFVMQIGHSTQSKGNADTKNFHQPADAFVYPKTNELFVADGYGNHRVVVMDADTGAYKRMWGAYGKKPVDSDPCPPVTLKSVPDGPGPINSASSTLSAYRTTAPFTLLTAKIGGYRRSRWMESSLSNRSASRLRSRVRSRSPAIRISSSSTWAAATMWWC